MLTRTLWILVAALCTSSAWAGAGDGQPNVIVIMADDLGWAELGCTGSERIRTPNIDRMREEGMLFTDAYSGSTVCAPSRCVLITGLHTGHSQIRDNGEVPNFDGIYGGQRGLLEGTETIARALRRDGYATAAVGKWGLGGPHEDHMSGHPLSQGFGFWSGFLCQRNAHNYYPYYIWRNTDYVALKGNNRTLEGEQYVPDICTEDSLAWIQEHAEDPFFLCYWTPVPHLALQVPPDSLQEYIDKGWKDPPYTGGGYLACDHPRARYAAMVTRWDRDMGMIMDLLVKLGIDDNTVIFLTSDNGSTYNVGGYDPSFFNGTGGLRGHKGQLYEGGIRVPFIARWPGQIAEDSTSNFPIAAWDLFPTILEITGASTNAELDGISILPTLTGAGKQTERTPLYWEYHAGGGKQALRMGDWKGVRLSANNNPDGIIELYNLADDPNETTNVVLENPAIARQICELMANERAPSIYSNWNFCP